MTGFLVDDDDVEDSPVPARKRPSKPKSKARRALSLSAPPHPLCTLFAPSVHPLHPHSTLLAPSPGTLSRHPFTVLSPCSHRPPCALSKAGAKLTAGARAEANASAKAKAKRVAMSDPNPNPNP